MSRRVLFIYKDNLLFFWFVFGFYYKFSHIAHLSQLSCLSPYGARSSLFFHLSLSTIPVLPTWQNQVCAPALPFRNVQFSPPHTEGKVIFPSWPLGPCFLCRWRCGHRAWQGSPAPSGIYRHIMPSRGQSFFPSHRNTWDPCWPSSITCGDNALHLCDSWCSYSSSGYLYSEKANTWKLFRSAQLVIIAVSL